MTKRGSEVLDTAEASGMKKREAKRLMKEQQISQSDQQFNLKNIETTMQERAANYFNIKPKANVSPQQITGKRNSSAAVAAIPNIVKQSSRLNDAKILNPSAQ